MDRYTKTVLTVIAVLLAVIAVQNTRQANADGAVQRVMICSAGNPGQCATVFPGNGGTGVLALAPR